MFVCLECHIIINQKQGEALEYCPNCFLETLVYCEKYCYNCYEPLALNDLLFYKLEIDDDNLIDTLTEEKLKRKKEIIEKYNDPFYQFLCESCEITFKHIRDSNNIFESYMSYCLNNYRLLREKYFIHFRNFINKRVEIYNMEFGNINSKIFLQNLKKMIPNYLLEKNDLNDFYKNELKLIYNLNY